MVGLRSATPHGPFLLRRAWQELEGPRWATRSRVLTTSGGDVRDQLPALPKARPPHQERNDPVSAEPRASL